MTTPTDIEWLEALEDCPCCGSPASVSFGETDGVHECDIICEGCGLTVGDAGITAEKAMGGALALWNRRTPPAKQSLSSARAEIEGLKTERDEAQMELKRHFPVSKYNGLDIEQWKDRALAAERILALSGQHWRELWYGSEPQKGSWIYADREPVAFIGPDATAHALTTAIVIAHNAAIVSARAEGWKAGIEAAAKVARERAANIDDTIARTQVATHLAMQLSARLDEVSRLATTIESLGGINPRVDDAHEALLRDLARVERPADADDRPCDDTWEDANLLWDFADRARSALDEGRAPSGVASHKSRQEGEDDGG